MNRKRHKSLREIIYSMLLVYTRVYPYETRLYSGVSLFYLYAFACIRPFLVCYSNTLEVFESRKRK